MAKTQHQDEAHPHPDLLAAVVLHTLVAKAGERMTVSRIATACERDPSQAGDMSEIETAVESLLDDGLAQRDGELVAPTHAAIRASELSF